MIEASGESAGEDACNCEGNVITSDNFATIFLYISGAILAITQFTLTCLLKSRCTNVKCGCKGMEIQRQVVNDASVTSFTESVQTTNRPV